MVFDAMAYINFLTSKAVQLKPTFSESLKFLVN